MAPRLATLPCLALTLAALTSSLPSSEASAVGACASVDVLFLFDTTGSMGGVLSSAKSGATTIMNNVLAQDPSTRFGVADYRDYPSSYSYPGYSSAYGSAGDYPWRLDAPLGAPTATVQASVNGLSAGGGSDTPESMSRALSDSSASPAVRWASSVRIVVLFTDAPPHDLDFGANNFGGDPGLDATAGTADDLDFQAVVGGVATSGKNVVAVQSGTYAPATAALQYAATQTGGTYVTLGASGFVQTVTNAILAQIQQAPTVHAEAFDVNLQLLRAHGPAVVLVNELNKQTAPADHAADVLGEGLGPYVALNSAVAGWDVLHSEAQASSSDLHALARVTGFSLEVNGAPVVSGQVIQAASHTRLSPLASDPAESRLVGLRVLGGAPQDEVPAPNTVIEAAGVKVVLNEQAATSGTGVSALLVNMVHAYVTLPGVGLLDLIVSHAYTYAVECGHGLADPPAPECPDGEIGYGVGAVVNGQARLDCVDCQAGIGLDPTLCDPCRAAGLGDCQIAPCGGLGGVLCLASLALAPGCGPGAECWAQVAPATDAMAADPPSQQAGGGPGGPA
jgi:hypothetical protein